MAVESGQVPVALSSASVYPDGAATAFEIAADLGYADHAHLTREFRRVLGFTPSGYRSHLTSDGRVR